MTLEKFQNSLFNSLSNWIEIEYDEETKQYCLVNEETPWVYGIWETKQIAVDEYLSSLRELILINQAEKNEVEALA